jgi:serine/threonine protein kinase
MCSSRTRDCVKDLRILETVMMALAPLPDDSPATSDEGWWPATRRQPLPLPLGSRWSQLILEGPAVCGAYGTVYRAFDPRLRVTVALKLPNSRLPSRHLNRHLLEEAEHLSRVRHGGVVRMYGAATDRRRAGLWMELLRGQTLDQVLRTQGRLIATEVARIGHDLCAALAAIHAAGLVHGDIKPQNVFRESNGRVVIIDFGSASELSRQTRSRRGLTGTPLYLAPEVKNDGATSVASDIYSLGVLLFHLASRDYPVSGRTVEELSQRLAHGDVQRLKIVRPDLPDDLCRAVDCALSIDPQARFRSAAEMQHTLSRLFNRRLSSVVLTIGAACFSGGRRDLRARSRLGLRSGIHPGDGKDQPLPL